MIARKYAAILQHFSDLRFLFANNYGVFCALYNQK